MRDDAFAAFKLHVGEETLLSLYEPPPDEGGGKGDEWAACSIFFHLFHFLARNKKCAL